MTKIRHILFIVFLSLLIQQSCNKPKNKNPAEIPENFDPSFVLLSLNKNHANLILEDETNNLFYLEENNVEQMIEKYEYATLFVEPVTEENGVYTHIFKAIFKETEGLPLIVKTKLFQVAYYEVTSTNDDILIDNVKNTIEVIGFPIAELQNHLEKSALATWSLDVRDEKLTVTFGKKIKTYQIKTKLNLWEEGTYTDALITEIRPSNISFFKRNPTDYQDEKKEQLKNYDLTDWVVNTIYTPPTNVLNNHPAFFNSPRYAKTKKNGSYEVNTLYEITDGKGELLIQRTGQFGSSLSIISKASLGLLIPAIPGQLTNAQPYSDAIGLQNPTKMGFVVTEKASDNMFNSRPNAMVIYFKYRPKGSDKAVFEVSLHKGFGLTAEDTRLPAKYFGSTAKSQYKTVDEKNVVAYGAATVTGTLNDVWYRAVVPIYYKNDTEKPEHVIVNISSSDLTDGTADHVKEGSDLEIDRIVFAY